MAKFIDFNRDGIFWESQTDARHLSELFSVLRLCSAYTAVRRTRVTDSIRSLN